ncbi:PAQR family membrane homeostasis protein TrhA [Sedimentibacter sp. MB31-C6]|uniref:PAQR family membrane homeostasis protein TrhA n=1 Tax=Sedimentibacter sp. MB31-C6 TaxID=3109366 RepID=UPI002DDD7E40|nr:hemolysin III family protein [Sedimentibacter sp. MB36-C1]WSI05042.1 hemolysin III family protein [Sedimentibacter sp. MB36-C1]
MNKDKKEITSALTHLGGAIFGVIGMFMLLSVAIKSNNTMSIIAFIVFGLSMIMLYSTSTIYHFIDKSKKRAKLVMRKLDHIMIFVLISGTYTPICLLVLNKSVGYKLLSVVWTITLIGVFIKIFWISAPRWVSSGLYIGMGWMSILVMMPLVKSMSAGGMFWLVLGGLLYTIGGVIYGLKKPNINKPWFGFHELFHVFVLAGTFCHFIMMYLFIV